MEEEDQKFRMGLDYFVICLSGLGLSLPKQKQTPTTKSNSNKCILLVIQIAVGALPYKTARLPACLLALACQDMTLVDDFLRMGHTGS